MDLLSRLLQELRITSTTVSKWEIYPGSGVDVRGFAPGYLLSVVSGEPLVVEHGSGAFVVEVGEAVCALQGGDCRIGSKYTESFEALENLPWQGYEHSGYSIEDPPDSGVQVVVGEPMVRGQQPTIVAGFAFVLKGGGVASLAEQLPEFIHLTRSLEQANQLMQGAVEFLINDNQPGCLAAAVQLAEFTVTNALRGYILSQEHFPVGVLRGLNDPRIAKVMQYIAKHYAEPIELSVLSDIAGMSRSAFAEAFASNIGETPIAYLNRVRVEKAVDLLKQSRRKTADLAQSCGFGTDRSMRFAFKRVLGKTPKEFRAKRGFES